jgi:FkbM family methyltransferase
MIKKIRIRLARFVLSHWMFPRGIHCLTKIMLFNLKEIPENATFKFKYGIFSNVSIKRWPWGYWDLFFYGEMEKDELLFWKKIIRKGDTVVDVGANFGYWTLVGSKIVGNNGKVLSFEPIEKTFKTLSRNISASNARNVSLYNLGLSNHNFQTHFNLSSKDDISGSSSQGGQTIVNFDTKQIVNLVSLDGLINNVNSVRLIKIDIEGGELFALMGMEKLLKVQHPVITFEWNVLTAEAMGYHPDNIILYLESLNYKIRIVHGNKLIKFDKSKFLTERVLMLWALHKTEKIL